MLIAGVTPDHMREVAILTEMLEKINENLELLDRSLKMYDKIPGSKRTKETEVVRTKIIRAKVMEAARQKSLRNGLRLSMRRLIRQKRKQM